MTLLNQSMELGYTWIVMYSTLLEYVHNKLPVIHSNFQELDDSHLKVVAAGDWRGKLACGQVHPGAVVDVSLGVGHGAVLAPQHL